ncbi:hypothetical protein L2Y96_18245 [Luteibacter aegosomaticola]|uniref:hypothetical protein n=1 Tax=Luteibacter aegosomaticola TaxID=2911538 RepID=UPI001FFB9B85|nr:hypothetical protein [Luteibacter aegosomaticola]UPG89320.1 hypothetical protein L2Y96_18245 [Luteibacter aegosomaticola]
MMFRDKGRYAWNAFSGMFVGLIYGMVLILAIAGWFSAVISMTLRATSDCAT